ncbi:EamA family transporter [Desulforamulus ruminis]|uniref:DMT family transporter n=1 Tax=Desulforamulus ruminis TaxID=1564 RepID=UPI002FD9ECC9
MASTAPRSIAAPNSPLWVGLFHLFVVYIVWGSTYLAIRVGVREGSGFPPFSMGGSRLLAATAILFLVAVITRQSLKISPKGLWVHALSGFFLWVGGNGLVMWGEQRADSGYAALLVASVPLWVAIIEGILDRKIPSKLLIGSLLMGFLGIGVLSFPTFRTGGEANLHSIFALLLAPLFWGIGMVVQRRNPVALSPIVSSGYQQLFGAIGFILAALLLGEPWPNPTPEAWWAWGYLVVFGSLFAFTSFIMALKMLPTSLVVTYAYVNPVVAVFLGWLILHEPLNVWTLAGTVLVLVGVAGTFKHQSQENKKHATQE